MPHTQNFGHPLQHPSDTINTGGNLLVIDILDVRQAAR
jgi:hypothetical protein